MAEDEKSPKPEEEVVEKKIVKIEEEVKPAATIRRRSVMERATDDIANEVVYDVVVPRGKDFLWDIGNGILDILSDIMGTALFGDRGASNKNVRRGRRGSSYQNYNSISYRERRNDMRDWNRGSTLTRDTRPMRGNRRDREFDLDDIVFDRRREAETVLNDLIEDTMNYGQVTVDAYLTHPLVRVPSTNAMDRKLGWDDLSDAQIRNMRGGYVILLPRPKRLDLD